MKSLRTLLLAAFSALSMSGCLQFEGIVKLNPDGSGTFEQTLTISKTAPPALKGLLDLIVSNNAQPDARNKTHAESGALFDAGKLRDQAENMGPGVKYVFRKRIDTDTVEGYSAVFSFTDINRLKLSQDLQDAPARTQRAPRAERVKAGAKPAPSDGDSFVFHFTKGNPAELDIIMPRLKFPPPPPKDDHAQPMPLAIMQQLYKDLKVTVAVDFQGAIRETNATYRQDSRITLLHMDYDKFLANPENFEQFAKENNGIIQWEGTTYKVMLPDNDALLKNDTGIRTETAHEIKVKFQ